MKDIKYEINLIDEQNQKYELNFTFDGWQKIFKAIQIQIPNIDEDVKFYDAIVVKLKEEARRLNEKLYGLRIKDDMNLYISTLKSLRETLDLISKFDWKLNYSEFKTEDGIDHWLTQVSVWEQNHDNQIRNHKVWDVVNCDVKIENDSNIDLIVDKVIGKINAQMILNGVIR